MGSIANQRPAPLNLGRRRVNFLSSVFKVSSATQPSVIIGFGIDRARFEECFSDFGRIMEGGAA